MSTENIQKAAKESINVIDNETGFIETLLEHIISNRLQGDSFNVTQKKRTEKGINCTQWFSEKDFIKRFKFQ